jgi:vacuolar-type H+-ATPase subunit H
MKKKNKDENIIVSEPPQQSLEKILKTEIQVAQKIAEAKETAEKSVITARDEIIGVKEKIIEQARIDRERLLAEGLEVTNIKAQEDLTAAKMQSQLFFEKGQQFIDSAADQVIALVLDQMDGEK